MKMPLDPELAVEAKALVALAFRNGPIEGLHAGRPCAVCNANREISHITDEEMKAIMKSAVDAIYRLLWLRNSDPAAYKEKLELGRRFTLDWDDPELKEPTRKGPRPT
jgi:hypothetical protein